MHGEEVVLSGTDLIQCTRLVHILYGPTFCLIICSVGKRKKYQYNKEDHC